MKRLKVILYLSAAAAGIFAAVRYSEECYRGISGGISLCIGVLIPSLFVFMVIAAFIVKSRLAQVLTRPLRGISGALFKLPPESLCAVLLSLLGGYPIGARCIASLYAQKSLTQKQAQKTAYIAVAAGPGFVINYVGMALLNSKSAGFILLTAQTVSVLIVGFTAGKLIKCDCQKISPKAMPASGSLLVDAVADASKGAFSMCAMVVVFCALNEVMSTILSRFPDLVVIVSGLIEVTAGVNRNAQSVPMWITAFYIGFGGLSVHFQIFASLRDVGVNKAVFLLFRLLQGISAGAAAYILVSIFPETQAVFSTAQAQSAGIFGTAWGSAALVLSSLVFLGSVTQGGEYVRNCRNRIVSDRSDKTRNRA